MDKPTVFFSHSSIDRDYISELQKGVNSRTSGTVNIFQSSDGESIPFGNNWVHQIEENLHKAKIMFVFISPESMSSSWIYFESGFAYSKGVKVIPIGIKGVDIGQLKPPLNLLQGFNIVSKDGMNNILSIMNDEFHCYFPASFEKSDFESISIHDDNSIAQNSEVFSVVDHITLEYPFRFGKVGSDDENKLADNSIALFQEKLDKLGLQSSFSRQNKLHAHGLVAVSGNEHNSSYGLTVKIDPFMLKTYEALITDFFEGMYEKQSPEKCWFNVFFDEKSHIETTDYKVSSKLSRVHINLSDLNGNFYKLDNLDFTLIPKKNHSLHNTQANLRVIYKPGQFLATELINLLSVLKKTRVVE